MNEQKPKNMLWASLTRPMGPVEARTRILFIALLGTGSIVAAYFGLSALSAGFRTFCLAFAILTLIRLFHTFRQ